MSTENKLILVTGANGFLGTYVVDELLTKNYSVRAFIRRVDSSIRNKKRLEVCHGCLSDKTSLKEALCGIAGIVHLACSLTNDFLVILENDIFGMWTLVQNWRKGPFIYVSSMDVYGETRGCLIDEQEPLRPATNYGLGKLLCEQMLIYEGGILEKNNYKIFRLPYIFGRHQKFRESMLGRIITHAFSEEDFVLSKNQLKGDNGTSWISAKEAASVIVSSLNKRDSGIFNVSTGYLSWKEMITEVIRVTGSSSRLIFEKGDTTKKTFYTRNMHLSIEKAQNILGFQPRASFKTTLKEIIKIG